MNTGSMPTAIASPDFFPLGKKCVDQLGNTYKVVKVTENTAVLRLVKEKFWRNDELREWSFTLPIL